MTERPGEAQEKLGQSRSSAGRGVYLAALLFELAQIPAAFALGWMSGRMPGDTLRFTAGGLALGIAATIPMLPLFVWCDRSSRRPLRRIRHVLDTFLEQFLKGRSIGEVALLAAAAGIGEEFLFRGAIQGGFEGWVGRWGAWVAASLVFGLAHAATRLYVFLAAAIGLYLGGIWLATGDLLVPIVAHGLYDFIALCYFLRRGQSALPDDRGTGPR